MQVDMFYPLIYAEKMLDWFIWCSVVATIMALPNPSTGGRLLLLLKSVSELIETSSSKRAKKKSSYNVGSLVQAEVYIYIYI